MALIGHFSKNRNGRRQNSLRTEGKLSMSVVLFILVRMRYAVVNKFPLVPQVLQCRHYISVAPCISNKQLASFFRPHHTSLVSKYNPHFVLELRLVESRTDAARGPSEKFRGV